MPNNITNVIKANNVVIESLRGENGDVDFNTLIPIPKSLIGLENYGSDVDLVQLLYGQLSINPPSDDLFLNVKFVGIVETLQKGGLSKLDNERFDNFIAMLKNYREYGFVNWYDFSNKCWGTKWNAYNIVKLSDSSVQFDTAWNAPHPVIEALVLKFPDICIEHLWADDDIGSNLGHRRYCCGVSNVPIGDPVHFALCLHEEFREFYKFNSDTGKWEYFDPDDDV